MWGTDALPDDTILPKNNRRITLLYARRALKLKHEQ